MNKDLSPIRVLHVVGILQQGGIETWLMHVLHHFNRDRMQIDFLVQTDHPGAYDEIVRKFGCNIYVCPIRRSQPWRYARRFQQILRDQGPYHIIHSHVHLFSGFTLRLAKRGQIPVRIAHSHNDTSVLGGTMSWPRKLYSELMRHWIQRHATLGLAASREAARDLFGSNWSRDLRWRVLYYGIDLEPFREVPLDPKVRAEFGIPPHAFVLGHIGRFEHQKNHPFLLKIAAEVMARQADTYLLMIGDGPLRKDIEAEVARTPYKSKMIFAGLRRDIAQLMLHGMDVFLLPSFYEGLPVVGIEAQAAGLPIVLSQNITPELDAIASLIHRVPLEQAPSIWADVILNIRNQHQSNTSPLRGTSDLSSSPFNIQHSVRQLELVYEKSIKQS
ncbi:MAG TPA: glycosyltransferase [Stenomitos sp.]